MRVIDITPENVDEYDENTLKNGVQECFLQVHSPNCGFCQQLKPEWEKLKEYAKKNGDDSVLIVSLDGSVKDKFNLPTEIHGYPTILYLNKDGTIKDEYKSGDRSFENLKKFLLSQNSIMNGGGKKYRSKKHKLRKYRSKKHRSRKHMSRKDRSRKHRSKKLKFKKY